MDIYKVTVNYNGMVYEIQFDEASFLQFQKDPSYVKEFLPTETTLDGDGDVTGKLTSLIDGKTGKEIDLNVDPDFVDIDDGCTGVQFPFSSEDAIDLNNTSTNSTNDVQFDRDGSSNVRRKGRQLVAASKAGTSNSTSGYCSDSASQAVPSSGYPNSAKKKSLRKTKVRLNAILEGELLDDAEAHLLQLVFDRPVLFDYTLPIAERNPNTLMNTWSDVHKEMKQYIKEVLGEKANNLEITLDTIKETWLNIRMQYMRYRGNTKKKTGMSPNETPPMKHLDLLRNYETVATKRRTLSNMEEEDDDDEYDDEYAKRRVNEAKPPTKRGRVNDEFLSAAQKALTSFNKRLERPPVSNPMSKTTPDSSSSHFAGSIVADLNLLNSYHLTRAKMRITQIIHEELSQQNEQQ